MLKHSSSSTGWWSLPTRGPSVRTTLPPLSYFKIPPAPEPRILLPPADYPSLAVPFQIPTWLYNDALEWQVPVTIAVVYAVIVTSMNRLNKQRKLQPWAFSKTRFFRTMVLIHNLFLAIYSGWTFIGMFNALNVSLYNPFGEYGVAGTVDSLCKINGPRGLGSAATFNEHSKAWSIADRAFKLGADGLTPDPTDVGRIWNSGLAFYGWLFYMSKFYEVLDTFIILAKGKKSSLLQTYHHAGAMLCMWAGIRYMSPPIWMFVFVNSFIHTIMYTFYFCTALGVKVPKPLKQTLTTLQITQFVVGTFYAFSHLFVKYQSPVDVPYIYHLGDIVSAVASDASTAASSIATAATSAASQIDWWAVGRKIALRAAGREGLAQNVVDRSGHTFGVDAKHAARDFMRREETRYRQELVWTPCLDTSGQTFAILLNCVYLLPLTWLFVRFFVRSYLHRTERRRSSTVSQKAYIAGQSARDAGHGVGRRMSEAFEEVQEGVENGDDFAILDDVDVKEELKKAGVKAKEAAASVKEEAKVIASKVKDASGKAAAGASEKAQELQSKAQATFQDDLAKAKEQLKETKDGAVKKVEEFKKAASEKAEATKNDTAEALEKHSDDTTADKPGSQAKGKRDAAKPKDDDTKGPDEETSNTRSTAKGTDATGPGTSQEGANGASSTTEPSSPHGQEASQEATKPSTSASSARPGTEPSTSTEEHDTVKEVIQDTKIAPLDSSYVEVATEKKDKA